jgi:hypothetical protein
MINLPCSEAYALDYLAILYIKSHQKLPVADEIKTVYSALESQIPNLEEVLQSKEFFVLCRANQSVFDAVATSKSSPTQVANRARYRAKVALQRKFWPSTKLSECKTKEER